MTKQQPKYAGFTMVEMMVSMTVSSLVVMAAMAVMASQRPIFQQQQSLQAIQESVWLSIEQMQRDIRQAGSGFGYCARQPVGSPYLNQGEMDVWRRGAAAAEILRAVEVTDGGDAGPNNSDTIKLVYAQPRSAGAPDARLTTTITNNLYGTNPIATNDGRGFMNPVGCTCGTCTFPTTPPYPTVVIHREVERPINCAIFQITGVSCTGGTLTRASLSTTPWNPSATQAFPTTTYQAWAPSGAPDRAVLANLGTLTEVTYFIDVVADPTMPRLVRRLNRGDGQPVVDQIVAFGIEDMQIVPACDVDQDAPAMIDPEGTPSLTNDEWFNNVAADVVQPNCRTYRQVRITLVGRSLGRDADFTTGRRPAIANRAAATATDNFHRRMITSTVDVPNLSMF